MNTIDVREIPPINRHPLIFRTFDALDEGEAFELVNDHDPKPLYYQFLHERPNQFSWEYLEKVPQPGALPFVAKQLMEMKNHDKCGTECLYHYSEPRKSSRRHSNR